MEHGSVEATVGKNGFTVVSLGDLSQLTHDPAHLIDHEIVDQQLLVRDNRQGFGSRQEPQWE